MEVWDNTATLTPPLTQKNEWSSKSPQDLWPQFNRQYACAKKKIQEISFAFVYIVNSNKRLNEKQKMP
jgi:hypothetical protein